MEVNSVNYTGYAASASVTRDKDGVKAEASAASVSVSKTTVQEDSFVPSKKVSKEAEAVGYKPSKRVAADFIEDLEKRTYELMKSLTEKMISAQSKKGGDNVPAGLDLSSLAQALGLGADAGMSDIQGLVDGLHLGVDVSGMSYGDIAGMLGIGTTPETAAAAISEDGMWGVNAVSTRLIDFAMGLAAGDPSKIAELREAVTKGFEAVGAIDSLPQVCQDTYAETMKRFDYWEEHGSMDGYGETGKTEDAGAAAGGVHYEESMTITASSTTIET